MSSNKVNDGGTMTVTVPSGGYTSGQGVLVGAVFGVVHDTKAEGETAVLKTTGTFILPKPTSSSTGGSAGDRAYWDNTAKKVTAVSTSNTEIGYFHATCADGDATCEVTLGVRTIAAA